MLRWLIRLQFQTGQFSAAGLFCPPFLNGCVLQSHEAAGTATSEIGGTDASAADTGLIGAASSLC